MTIVSLSNFFNMIAQQLGLKNYHFGIGSDINRNVDNNFNVGNSNGREYPSILFIPPSGSYLAKRNDLTYEVQLMFCDLQYYNNDSSTNQRQMVEVFADLEQIVVNFFKNAEVEVKSLSRQDKITFSDIATDYIPFAANDRLCCIQCSFSVSGLASCEDIITDIATLAPTYESQPIGGEDYEKIKP